MARNQADPGGLESVNRRRLFWIRTAFALFVAAGLVLILSIWLLVPALEGDTLAGGEILLTPAELAANPDSLFGRKAVIGGEVARVISPRAVVIDGVGFADGAEVLLVGPAAFPAAKDGQAARPIARGDIIQAAGMAWRFDIEEFESVHGVDLPDSALEAWRNRASLVVQSAKVTGPRFRAGGTE